MGLLPAVSLGGPRARTHAVEMTHSSALSSVSLLRAGGEITLFQLFLRVTAERLALITLKKTALARISAVTDVRGYFTKT